MSRSIKKGPYIDKKLIDKIKKLKSDSGNNVIKTWNRAATIIPVMVGHTIAVHNGKVFLPIYISENMVGHKLGEFAPTRTYKGHANERSSKVKK